MSANLGGFISATFDPFSGKPTTVEYLVVAGGGGGGGYFGAVGGGGGGAGGLLTATNFPVTAGANNTITVGAGGTGASSNSGDLGTRGQDSVFSSIVATGGGASGAYNVAQAQFGGSGSGSTYSSGGGTGIAGQGFAGGTSTTSYSGGGGGGAGSVGLVGTQAVKAGDGGTGQVSTITGSRVFYAGGGGGGTDAYALALGGAGGGGSGAQAGKMSSFGTTAQVNTGGGGGGGFTTAALSLGNGGSGIVIIRYPASQSAPVSTTGSPQINYADGYQIYTFTSSGTITF